MSEFIFTRATRVNGSDGSATLVYSRIRTSGEIEAQVTITKEGEISRVSCKDYGLDFLERTILPIEPYISNLGIYEIGSETEFNAMWLLAEKS